MRMYQLAQEEVQSPATQIGLPPGTLGLSNQQVVKLNKGPVFPQAPEEKRTSGNFFTAGEGIGCGRE